VLYQTNFFHTQSVLFHTGGCTICTFHTCKYTNCSDRKNKRRHGRNSNLQNHRGFLYGNGSNCTISTVPNEFRTVPNETCTVPNEVQTRSNEVCAFGILFRTVCVDLVCFGTSQYETPRSYPALTAVSAGKSPGASYPLSCFSWYCVFRDTQCLKYDRYWHWHEGNSDLNLFDEGPRTRSPVRDRTQPHCACLVFVKARASTASLRAHCVREGCTRARCQRTSIACRAIAVQSALSLTPVCWASQQGYARGFQGRSATRQQTRSPRPAPGPVSLAVVQVQHPCTERECCLLVLNLVSSTLPCIRRPRPRLRVLDVRGFV
jgi:hypothetical protein